MIHLFKKFAMVAILLSVALPHISAHDFEAEGLYFNIKSAIDFTASVSGLADPSIVDLKIPSEVTYKNKKLKVIEIGTSAFSGSDIHTVNISEGVVTLDSRCFEYCEQLSKVVLPSTLRYINNGVFSYDKNLTQCDLKNVEEIWGSAFAYTGITRMTIPNSCKELHDGAFSSMEKLEQITLPSNLATIPNNCFLFCSNLKEIALPTSLESLARGAFYCCSSLKELHLPQSLNFIGDEVFHGCESMTELVIPDRVTYIGYDNYKYLKSITFGTGLVGLLYSNNPDDGIYTMNGTPSSSQKCTNLENVIIKDTEINFRLHYFFDNYKCIPPFSNCAIKYYYIGRPIEDMDTNSSSNTYYELIHKGNMQGEGHINVLEIAGNCREVPFFFQCIDTLVLGKNITDFDAKNIYTDKIKVIQCKSTMPPKLYNYTKIKNRTYTDATIYVPRGTLAKYQATDGWKDFWDIQENDAITDVNEIKVCEQESEPQYYDLQGRKLSKPQKGINIIKGRKVFLK